MQIPGGILTSGIPGFVIQKYEMMEAYMFFEIFGKLKINCILVTPFICALFIITIQKIQHQ
jgi:hypothetical protein